MSKDGSCDQAQSQLLPSYPLSVQATRSAPVILIRLCVNSARFVSSGRRGAPSSRPRRQILLHEAQDRFKKSLARVSVLRHAERVNDFETGVCSI
jgi:hypothetical protein